MFTHLRRKTFYLSGDHGAVEMVHVDFEQEEKLDPEEGLGKPKVNVKKLSQVSPEC